jgi:hypothetical protein
LRGSPREAALNRALRGELLARQGQEDAACRILTDAASELRAMGMHWHAARATGELEAKASLTGS